MSQLTIPQALQMALAHHQAARFAEAENLYRQILSAQPKNPDALHMLGVLAGQMGHLAPAIDLIQQSLAIAPAAGTFSNLAQFLRQAGRLDDAITACRRAVDLNPKLAQSHNNLGTALLEKGLSQEAIASFRTAIALDPTLAEAHSNLGNALTDLGELPDAIASFDAALRLNPARPELHNNRANALRAAGRAQESAAACNQALRLNPNFPEAYDNLGNALTDLHQTDDAIAAFQKALTLKPSAATHINLARALRQAKRLDDATQTCHDALKLNPHFAEAHMTLALCLQDQGRIDEALAANRQAVQLRPNVSQIHSNLLFALHYDPKSTPASLCEEHRLWAERHAAPLAAHITAHPNTRDPARRLRIGYLSPDFTNHAVGRFMLPLLANHDPSQVEIFCYADVSTPDPLTARLQSHAHHWQNTLGMPDDRLAHLIRQDQIDILIDLTMHSALNRMLLFARKPAPVQATYLAYCSTTGLTTIDYRLTDPFIDPPELSDSDDSAYSEKSLRLPHTYWCYAPTDDAARIPIQPTPALATGQITLGSLNNFWKISQPTLNTWADLLQSLPSARLLLHAPPGSHRERLLAHFATRSIAANRITFAAWVPPEKYFQQFHQIDIALDPFPYGGGTTTCDALWMGVPVITLAGKTAVGRGGISLLNNIGLPELIAHSPDHYITIARKLATDFPRLSTLRSTIRPRMQQSHLMNAPAFAQDIESAYRTMWTTYCNQKA